MDVLKRLREAGGIVSISGKYEIESWYGEKKYQHGTPEAVSFVNKRLKDFIDEEIFNKEKNTITVVGDKTKFVEVKGNLAVYNVTISGAQEDIDTILEWELGPLLK